MKNPINAHRIAGDLRTTPLLFIGVYQCKLQLFDNGGKIVGKRLFDAYNAVLNGLVLNGRKL